VSVSLVFDGDLNTMNVEQKAQFTYTAIGELVDRFDNVSRDDIESATLSAGSILLVVEFYPGTVSVDEAYTVVSDANTGNPIYASAGNATHSTSTTFVDKYTEAPTATPSVTPTAAPTTSPTIGSWCGELVFGQTCSESSESMFEVTMTIEGDGYDKMIQCTMTCETHDNVGCCEYELLSFVCRGFPRTLTGTTLPSSLPRASSSCIIGPNWRTTVSPETTVLSVDEDAIDTAGGKNGGVSLTSAQKQHLLVGILALGSLVLLVMLVRMSMKQKLVMKLKNPESQAESNKTNKPNTDTFPAPPQRKLSEAEEFDVNCGEQPQGKLFPWRAQFATASSMFSTGSGNPSVGDNNFNGEWDNVGGYGDARLNEQSSSDNQSHHHPPSVVNSAPATSSRRGGNSGSAKLNVESRLPPELRDLDALLMMDRAFDGRIPAHFEGLSAPSQSAGGRLMLSEGAQSSHGLGNEVAYQRGSQLAQLPSEIYEIFNGVFNEHSLELDGLVNLKSDNDDDDDDESAHVEYETAGDVRLDPSALVLDHKSNRSDESAEHIHDDRLYEQAAMDRPHGHVSGARRGVSLGELANVFSDDVDDDDYHIESADETDADNASAADTDYDHRPYPRF
jgi:hypothetical protein